MVKNIHSIDKSRIDIIITSNGNFIPRNKWDYDIKEWKTQSLFTQNLSQELSCPSHYLTIMHGKFHSRYNILISDFKII